MYAMNAAVVEPLYDHTAVENARLVNQARARLLTSAGAVTFEMIADATDRRPDAVRQWVNRRVRAHRMITITHEGSTLVPTFQLTAAFEEDRTVGDIVGRLVEAGMSGWAVWDWFVTPNTWLDAETPLAVLRAGGRTAVEHAGTGMLQE